jgi:hypothetical protein
MPTPPATGVLLCVRCAVQHVARSMLHFARSMLHFARSMLHVMYDVAALTGRRICARHARDCQPTPD